MILIKLSFPSYKQVFCIFLLLIFQFLEFHLVLGFFFLYYFCAHLTFSLFHFIVVICFYRSCCQFFFFFIHLGTTFLSSQLNKYKRTTFFLSSYLSIPFPIFYSLIFFTILTKRTHYINLSLLARFWKLFHSSTLRNMGYMFLCIKLL